MPVMLLGLGFWSACYYLTLLAGGVEFYRGSDQGK